MAGTQEVLQTATLRDMTHEDVGAVMAMFDAYRPAILEQSTFEYTQLLDASPDSANELHRRIEADPAEGDLFARYLSRVALCGEKLVGFALATAPAEGIVPYDAFSVWDGLIVATRALHDRKLNDMQAKAATQAIENQLEAERREWARQVDRPIAAHVTTTGWTAQNRLRRQGFQFVGTIDAHTPYLHYLLVPHRELDQSPAQTAG